MNKPFVILPVCKKQSNRPIDAIYLDVLAFCTLLKMKMDNIETDKEDIARMFDDDKSGNEVRLDEQTKVQLSRECGFTITDENRTKIILTVDPPELDNEAIRKVLQKMNDIQPKGDYLNRFKFFKNTYEHIGTHNFIFIYPLYNDLL
jgi:hypothetical protein